MRLKKLSANETVLEFPNAIILFSYDTPVAAHTNGIYIRTELFHSNTTSRHINRWLGSADYKLVPQSELDELVRLHSGS
jgi:hypothetical protein